MGIANAAGKSGAASSTRIIMSMDSIVLMLAGWDGGLAIGIVDILDAWEGDDAEVFVEAMLTKAGAELDTDKDTNLLMLMKLCQRYALADRSFRDAHLVPK